jgi:5-methylcytosine-specific restriction endonuclease McrA
MERQKKHLQKNKRILYELHGYDPREGTKNVHHLVFKSEGGSNEFDNLSLLDKEFHVWIHELIQKIDGKRCK